MDNVIMRVWIGDLWVCTIVSIFMFPSLYGIAAVLLMAYMTYIERFEKWKPVLFLTVIQMLLISFMCVGGIR